MKPLNKPTFLLWLPVVVWAATFTIISGLFAFGISAITFTAPALKPILITTLFINIIVMSITCVAMTADRNQHKEYLLRLLLQLSNMPAIIMYKLIYDFVIN